MSWSFEASVVCAVPPEFAWSFWTDVRHWALDADVVSVEVDGPFMAGTQGVTNSKSSGPIAWRIAEATPGHAVIEFPLAGALGRFSWTFEAVPEGTRITQRCAIEGEQAESFAQAVGPSLEAGVPAGMQKLREAMEAASIRE